MLVEIYEEKINRFPVVIENANFLFDFRPSPWLWVLVLQSDIRVTSYLDISSHIVIISRVYNFTTNNKKGQFFKKLSEYIKEVLDQTEKYSPEVLDLQENAFHSTKL